VIKFVLLAVAILLLLPLLRRKEKPAEESSPKKKSLPPPKDAPKKAFDALMRTVVVLDGNEWSACTVDGVKEDWTRFTSEATRGFEAVPAGRHRVVTEVDDRTATLDFVLFPGETLSRKLDRDAAKWIEADAEKAPAESLVSYRSTMGIARAMSGKLASPEAAFEKAKAALEKLADKNDDAAIKEARTVGESLIGIPLVAEQLDALVAVSKRAPNVVEAALPGISRRQS
jgi:hypothetical protein